MPNITFHPTGDGRQRPLNRLRRIYQNRRRGGQRSLGATGSRRARAKNFPAREFDRRLEVFTQYGVPDLPRVDSSANQTCFAISLAQRLRSVASLRATASASSARFFLVLANEIASRHRSKLFQYPDAPADRPRNAGLRSGERLCLAISAPIRRSAPRGRQPRRGSGGCARATYRQKLLARVVSQTIS